MNPFEKIFERLRNLVENYERLQFGFNDSCEIQKYVGMEQAIDLAIEIVQEVAEEYNGGWIPCSERLPEDYSICMVTVKYPNNEPLVDYGWFDRNVDCWYVGMKGFKMSNIIAWQPLPEPYKERR